jgi:hypothetical protein
MALEPTSSATEWVLSAKSETEMGHLKKLKEQILNHAPYQKIPQKKKKVDYGFKNVVIQLASQGHISHDKMMVKTRVERCNPMK